MEITSCIKRFQDASALGLTAPTPDMLHHNNHLLGNLQQGTPIHRATIGEETIGQAGTSQQTQQVEFPSADQHPHLPPQASPALSINSAQFLELKQLFNRIGGSGRSSPAIFSDVLNMSGSSSGATTSQHYQQQQQPPAE